MNESFKSIGDEYSEKNREFQEMNNRAIMLSDFNKEKMQNYEKVE